MHKESQNIFCAHSVIHIAAAFAEAAAENRKGERVNQRTRYRGRGRPRKTDYINGKNGKFRR